METVSPLWPVPERCVVALKELGAFRHRQPVAFDDEQGKMIYAVPCVTFYPETRCRCGWTLMECKVLWPR